jgi:hypothetical protein
MREWSGPRLGKTIQEILEEIRKHEFMIQWRQG